MTLNIPLPNFRYHPDPLSTNSIEPSDKKCICCERVTGFIYVGPSYGYDDLTDLVCPWCIADGSVQKKFDTSFVSENGIGGHGYEKYWGGVSEGIVKELMYRTPGFLSLQEEEWPTHCNDAAQLLKIVDQESLEALGDEATKAFLKEIGYNEERLQYYYNTIGSYYGPNVYVFRCLHCGKLEGYDDSV